MSLIFRNVDDVLQFINSNEATYSYFKSFFQKVVTDKKLVFFKEYVGDGFDKFIELELITPLERENEYEIKYDSLAVQHTILTFAEDFMQVKLPKDPERALEFSKKFLEEIRKPKLNEHWYGGLATNFKTLD